MSLITVSYDGDTIIDATNGGAFKLCTAGKFLTDDISVTSDVVQRSSADLIASDATVTVPAGYYGGGASKSVASGSATTPATTITANPTITVNTTTGVVTATTSASKSVTPAVSAGYVSAGTAGTVTVNGSGTSQIDVYDGTTYNRFPLPGTTLEDATWEQIAAVSGAGKGSEYWEVGDLKAITLNGTVGKYTFSNETYYAFIIGFSHNSEYEGGNRIHFQFGKTAFSGGKDICFIDSSYGSNVTTAAFHMNNSNTNSGGWNSSYMRNTVCGTSLSSYSGTFIAALPSDLRSVLKIVTKYTDNTGKQSTSAANVTATTDVIFLLSEYEVFGTIASGYSNPNESAKQAQYAYYAAGNSKVKYGHSSTGSAAPWWLRSPRSSDSTSFVYVNSSATVGCHYAGNSFGFAPGFCV